uniref:Enoyl reductase (ER) domain-containing protein n=1 Tax=Lotharella oceanica TaxID=641309 RepID=A0A7S2TTF2_9EUKA
MPEPKEGEVVVKATFISVDPYMRGRMTAAKSYVAGFEIDKPLAGGVAGIVVDSKADSLQKGDAVVGFMGWAKYQAVPAKSLRKVDAKTIPMEKHLSSAQYSGLSSWLPIKYIGMPKKGEVAFVNAAAGAVGSCACQLLQIQGLTVVGCAGSPEKIKWLEGLGIKAFNYKDGKFKDLLKKHCPNGIDVAFDNVGGEQMEAILENMNNFGRVICCGMISQYNLKPEDMYGVKNMFHIIKKRLKLQGFIMTDFSAEQKGEAVKELVAWISQKKLITTETVVEGFEKIPEAFAGLFTGKNLGKMLVKV